MGYPEELRDEILERVLSKSNPGVGKLAEEFGISRVKCPPKSRHERPSHKLCKPPERCKIESTDQEVLLWQEEIEIRNVKQSVKR